MTPCEPFQDRPDGVLAHPVLGGQPAQGDGRRGGSLSTSVAVSNLPDLFFSEDIVAVLFPSRFLRVVPLRPTPLAYRVSDILTLGSGEEVPRSNTTRGIAVVTRHLAGGEGAVRPLEDEDTGAPRATVPPEPAVPISVLGTGPQPAGLSLQNMQVESLDGRHPNKDTPK